MMEPPTPEKLKAVREPVAGITGLSTDRGDQLVVEALPFEATLAPEQMPPAPGPAATKPTDNTPAWLRDLFTSRFVAMGIAAGAVLGFGLLFLVLKKRRNKNKIRAEIQTQLSGQHATKAIDSGENTKEKMEAQIAEQSAT